MAEQENFAFASDTAGAAAPPAESEESSSRPEWLDDKFESTEALQEAYHSLQQKMGGDGEETSTVADTAEESAETAERMLGTESFSKYSDEYMDKGELSPDSYKEIKDTYGISGDLVDVFIQGQAAVADNHADSVFQIAGGKENYQNMLDWAGEHLPEDSIDSYNETVQGGDIKTIKLALHGLMAQYNASNPSLISGTGKATQGGYASKAEMMRDMGDKKYQEDAAFRNQVERKLANTPDGVI